MKEKLPPELDVYIYQGTFTVRFDYDAGESQWFDHRAGIGGPGCDPWVKISEIKTNEGWREPDEVPEIDLDELETALMDQIAEMQEERNNERADALYEMAKNTCPFL